MIVSLTRTMCTYPSGISGLVILESRAKIVVEYCIIEIIYLHKSRARVFCSPLWLSVKEYFHFCMCFHEIVWFKSSSSRLLVLWHNPSVYCERTDLLVTTWLWSSQLCKFLAIEKARTWKATLKQYFSLMTATIWNVSFLIVMIIAGVKRIFHIEICVNLLMQLLQQVKEKKHGRGG